MRRTVIALSMVVTLAGCGEDETSPSTPSSPSPSPATEATPEPTVAIIEATCTPSLVPAVVSSNPAFAWQISWVLTVRETAGISGRVNFLRVTIADQQVLTVDTAGVVAAAGSNAVAARGTLQIPLTLLYNLPTGDRLATVTTTVNFTDSRNNTIVQSAMLRII